MITLIDFILKILIGKDATLHNTDLYNAITNSSDSRRFALFPLLHHAILHNASFLPPDILQQAYHANLHRAIRIEHEVHNITLLLERNGIQSKEIKGQDIERLFYPEFGIRPQSDIDLLIQPQDKLLSRKVLVDNGYAWFISDFGADIYRYNDFQFDIHSELIGYRKQIIINEPFPLTPLFQQDIFPLELYFLFSCIQYVHEKDDRHMPAIDLFFQAKHTDIRLIASFTRKHPGVMPYLFFAHFDMLYRFGFSPININGLSLSDKEMILSKKINVFAQKKPSLSHRQLFMLYHSGHIIPKLMKIVFPPSRIIQSSSYVKSRGHYLKRLLGRVVNSLKPTP